MFFSSDSLVTKNQILKPNVSSIFLFSFYLKKGENCLTTSFFEMKQQQKIWLTFGI